MDVIPDLPDRACKNQNIVYDYTATAPDLVGVSQAHA